MSGYPGGQGADEASAARFTQEELKRQAAASRVNGAHGNAAHIVGSSFPAGSAYMTNLLADSAAAAAGQAAFYGATAPSPFGGPYSALSSQASPYADSVTAALYRQRYGYGAAAGVPPYAGHEYYNPHFARSPQNLAFFDRLTQQQKAAAGKTPTKSPAAIAQKATPTPTPSKTGSMAVGGAISPKPSPRGSPPQQQKKPRPQMPGIGIRVAAVDKAKKTLTNKDGEVLPEPGDWFPGCVPLGVEDDKYWLSELQVYLRSNFAEAFGATEDDIAAPMHGRNKPIALGQVGIRCMHCKNENPAERGQQATSYPSLISGIYNSVQQMLRLHLDCCQAMPPDVRAKIETLKLSSSSRGGRKQYWIDSAKRLGLTDTTQGIHFGRDPTGPLPPLEGPSVNSKEGRKKKEVKKKSSGPGGVEIPQEEEPTTVGPFGPPIPVIDDRPLVFEEDKPLISDYLYLTLEQMSPCVLMEADRVGCYKTRKVGFPGLACRHCVGQAGCGRYFPASEGSLSQTTTSQTIMNHVRNCRRCPVEIRESLEIMKRARMGPDGKRADKPKHGGRKVFFHRLWCRIQGMPIEDEKSETKEKKKRGRKNASKRSKKKNAAGSDSENEKEDKADAVPKLTESSEETETEPESDTEVVRKPVARSKNRSSAKKATNKWYDGCVRLTKLDDVHWLSDIQRFARSDLVEVFSWKKQDGLEGYTARKEPAEGQVAIRCVFCKDLKAEDRPAGCLVFPDSLSSIHSKVGDMIRLHFNSCPAMTEEAKEKFKAIRGIGSKKVDDSLQYWIDSARDLGLSNIKPPGGANNGWGITFRRNPLSPSPSDELDREAAGATTPTFSKSILIRSEDKGLCTDQVKLLMRQVKACAFQKSDKRGGPGARGRDRVIGFPGLSCRHCSSKSNVGRYFPVSAKNLTDNTANSILAHMSGCNRCPEPVKASLVFLSHRAIIQKAELSGSWKKAFFKKIWDRLHVERSWNEEDESDGLDDEEASVTSEEESDDEPGNAEGNTMSSDSEDENEDASGDNMDVLIKAAAIWLTEQDQVNDPGARNRNNGKQPSPLSGFKRSSPVSQKGKKRGSSLTSGKRRRVHF
eukprot:CAMPEP_0113610066 /NCGR_PEP_ID=MMETSP0017_2-20120614/4828_1 /TAXON_ID=2856 /ORGANISM="Cylindrotheca closterium" /LENGTH=1085 /DNA_ID=CAMNT_0000518929 /DNA_START=321 /DNA_END=3578 /DNA_ORIENTATION=- /assembly_acc=CAM_ASM_000147